MKKKITESKWYPYAVALCIAVVLYVLLVHLSSIMAGLGTFLGYFKTVFIGLILAYIINPLAKWLDRKLFYRIKNKKLEWTVSVAGAVVLIVLLLAFLLGTLIPQLVDSVTMLFNNMDRYMNSLKVLLNRLGLSKSVDLDKLFSDSGAIVKTVENYLTRNANDILNAGAQAGKSIGAWGIAFVLSVYILLNKDRLKAGIMRLMKALIPKKKLYKTLRFLTRCDAILIRYIVYSLIDALIVGVATALFMFATGMQYIGIISMIVAVTNLVPTFGPIVGGAIGGFILLLVEPVHAIVFILFAFVLQFFDAYIIKPKLFGDSLGVSGLLILIAVIVFGKMFGVVGMLFSIPVAAILDFVYHDVLLPYLEKRAKKRDSRPAEGGN